MPYSISLSGLKNAETELNVISNNLANAETTGFKSSSVSFSDLVAGSAYSNPKTVQGIGSTTSAITQDFSNGSMNSTGSALDLAVNGDGFFAVKSTLTGNMLYTRDGNFTTNSAGNITDQNGNNVQIFALSGSTYATTPTDAQLPTTNAAGSNYSGVQVKSDGSVIASYQDGSTTTIGKVALATFVAPTGLLAKGSQDWSATGISGTATYSQPSSNGTGDLLSGQLENSNVDMSTQMVNLITAQRYFQANSKAIDTTTQIADAVINLRS